MCRFVYNLGLEVKIRSWTDAKKNVSAFDLMKQLTELKRTECPWLAECSGQSLESALTNLDKAYTAFFKGSGFPKFKKRSGQQSIIFRKECSVKPGQARLTKLGWVTFLEHRPLGIGDLRTMTVTKNAADQYFISILIDDSTELPSKTPTNEETSVGIDVGLKTFATLSDGQTFENPRFLSRQLARLRKEQRTLARRYKKNKPIHEQSKGWHKQKLVVAKLHQKINNQREDFLHKTSTAIVKQYDTICMEDLNVSGIVKNRNLARAVSDVSWSRFNTMLEYKADWYGKNISYIGRFDPSSKLCSKCGNYFKELKLSDRVWTCEKCGSTHDRDTNAAENIKNFGLRNQPSTANESR